MCFIKLNVTDQDKHIHVCAFYNRIKIDIVFISNSSWKNTENAHVEISIKCTWLELYSNCCLFHNFKPKFTHFFSIVTVKSCLNLY